MSDCYGGCALGGYPSGGMGKVDAAAATSSVVGGAATGAAVEATLATSVATGAVAGSAFPVVGTIIGAVLGAAIYYLGSKGPPKTQQGGEFSVSGHRKIVAALIKAKRWDDADDEIRRWFAAGQGSADERARFHPNLPLILPADAPPQSRLPRSAVGKANYSLVARYGHQSSVLAATGQSPAQSGFLDSTTLALGAGAVLLLYLANRKRRAS